MYRCRALVILCVALIWAGAASAQALAATAKLEIAGADRYETAVEISKASFPAGSTVFILATGENWPDALGGAALAGALDCPVLLTRSDSLPRVVGGEIMRLGASEVYVLGGPSAISWSITGELESWVDGFGLTVHRLWGDDRYKTAAAVADSVVPPMYSGPAILTTGGDFPDSLAAGPLAAHKKWPIFLSNPRGYVPVAEMRSLGVDEVLIVGGTNAVSAAQESQLKTEFGPANVARVAGANRYDTAAQMAQKSVTDHGLNWNLVSITTGQKFPDALAGGPFAATKHSVMLITPSDTLHSAPRSKLEANAGSITALHYLGGTGAVSQTVRSQVANILP